MAAPRPLINTPRSLSDLNYGLFGMLKQKNSDPGVTSDFLGLVICLRDCKGEIDILPLSEGRTGKIAKLAQELRADGATLVARPQK